MPAPRLELRGVSKTYSNGEQPVEVLHDISLTAEAGTVTALLGRSGCGKSTLLNLAGAMDFPTSGEVLIDGRATAALSESELTALRRKRIGFVFQFFQLLPTLTVLENVELPLLLAGAAEYRRSRARPAALGGPRREGRELAVPAFRRTDAARRHRPRPGALARPADRRRAHRQSRHRQRRPGAGAAPRGRRRASAPPS